MSRSVRASGLRLYYFFQFFVAEGSELISVNLPPSALKARRQRLQMLAISRLVVEIGPTAALSPFIVDEPVALQ